MATQQEINKQIERFKKGFPWIKIVSPATPERGIEVLSEEEIKAAAAYADAAQVNGKCKFVPASGAASRMFKDIFAEKPESIGKLAENLEKFAFYTPEVFGTAPYDPVQTAHKLLLEPGLGYGAKPKGVLKFHSYPEEKRTAFAEHLVEGQEYMRNADGSVNLIVTISPEHTELFEAALADVKEAYEQKYGVKFNIKFTYQSKETDTIAVDPSNKPFLKEDGEPLFRPAGHGALIYNLNDVESELVSIKNIDNVSVERNLPVTALYKKVLMGRALKLRDDIFAFLNALDGETDPESASCRQLCDKIESFLDKELCIQIPLSRSCAERVEMLRGKLNRPVRVCGMVKNEGEPGGGPFVTMGADGCSSLQILESVQINPDDPGAQKALSSATHFNPVDLVCCIRNYKGEKFDLLKYVDEEAGFISSKSYQGRELKALELPGLWNGSMSDWNTLFVEVPVETFNPVKVVLDLLRPAHQ